MSKNDRWFYIWCLLVGAILSVSILPPGSWIYRSIAGYDSNRWLHFLAYASAATIPVAAWRRRRSIWFALFPVAVSIVFEALQAGIPGPIVRTQNVPADLFGAAAGILLGLNIRVMRTSAKSHEGVRSDVSRS